MTDGSEMKPKILIIDDAALNREILADMLSENFDILEADSGASGLALMQQHQTEIALVLLDIIMPSVDGFAVLSMMNEKGWLTDVPVIMISSETAQSQARRAYELGATDFISRPFDEMIVRNRVENTIKLYAKQRRLADMVAEQISERMRHNSILISVLSHIVEFRNGESGMHVLHINTITGMLLEALMRRTDAYGLKPSDVSLICTASSMHDIGKISIPSEILNKPGRLNADEFVVIKKHSEIGAEMIDGVPFGKDEPLIQYAYEICRWHHERWDGGGYPDGLQGEDIPIAAQIVSIADVYDALTSERVYKKAYSHERAMEMIQAGECGVFNPLLLECLNDISEELKSTLPNSTLGGIAAKDIKTVSAEMEHNSDLSSPNRVLRMVDYEHQKFEFFLAVSASSIFEYTSSPAMLQLSNAASEQLGLCKTIVDPMNAMDFSALCSVEEFNGFLDAILAATEDHTSFSYEMTLPIYDHPTRCRLYCNTVWKRDEEIKLVALYGKITQLQ